MTAQAAQTTSRFTPTSSARLDDPFRDTLRHGFTVGSYARRIARALRFPDRKVERIRQAGNLHDIGKLDLAPAILAKDGPLNAEEWAQVRLHPELGAARVTDPELSDIRTWILCHHERPDGWGYPLGLREAEIPLPARIIAVADAYEAMTSERVYQRSLTPPEARDELLDGAGTQFDAEGVEAFMGAREGQPEEPVEQPC